MRVSDIVAVPLQLGSALRRRRVFHPTGVLAWGRIERIAPVGEGLPIESTAVVARVSKALGTPGRLPDLVGLAWRMPQASATTAWDVLMVSAGPGAFTRFALRPTTSWTGTVLSTLMPLRHGGGRWSVTAELRTPLKPGLSLDSVRDAVDDRDLVFDIKQARGMGSVAPLATLTLTTVIPTDQDHDVSFDPVRNTAPGVTLGPRWLSGLRERAYRRSRRGRHAPDAGTLLTDRELGAM